MVSQGQDVVIFTLQTHCAAPLDRVSSIEGFAEKNKITIPHTKVSSRETCVFFAISVRQRMLLDGESKPYGARATFRFGFSFWDL